VIPPSGEQFELRFDERRAVVVEVGGGLRTCDDVLLGYEREEMCTSGRGQVLMPWPNRIAGGRYEFDGTTHQLPITETERGTAIHGLVRWSSWQAAEREDARVALTYVLHPQPGYPFTLRLRVEYTLDRDGLTVRTSAENVGERACPFGAGHHPYIAAPSGRVDDLELDGRPIGAERLDGTQARGGAWETRVSGVVVWADDAWPYVQIFTGDLPDVGRRGLAVEPMTCPPNAFNTGEGLIRLEPGETFAGAWGIRV
jgi:aldose 1-epimerase